jgi:hypothetical protein
MANYIPKVEEHARIAAVERVILKRFKIKNRRGLSVTVQHHFAGRFRSRNLRVIHFALPIRESRV